MSICWLIPALLTFIELFPYSFMSGFNSALARYDNLTLSPLVQRYRIHALACTTFCLQMFCGCIMLLVCHYCCHLSRDQNLTYYDKK
jgi:hypothetical protein